MMFMSPEDMERHQAAHEVMAHDVVRLFQELPQEHLTMVGFLLDTIAMGDSPVRTASYLSGRVSATLLARFKVCPACGKDHDKDLESFVAEDKPEDSAAPEVPEHIQARRRAQGIPEPGYVEVGSNLPITDWEQRLMDEYGLDDLREEGTDKLLGFICKNCSMQYVSIKDRMIRPPGVEGCSGCQQKAKFG